MQYAGNDSAGAAKAQTLASSLSATAARPRGVLDDVTQRLREVRARADSVADRLDSQADRLFGPQPQTATDNMGGIGVLDATVPALHQAVDALEGAISRLEAAAQRNAEIG